MALTISPNMSLPIPTVGQEQGPQYATDVNNSLTIIDQHTHTAGSGVLITPAAININASLPMNSYSLISIGALTLLGVTQPAASQSIWVSVAGDLQYINGGGVNVPITSGTSVIASSSGISSGTALASFVSSVLVVLADTGGPTPANIQGASLLLGLNSAGTNYLTLSPPASLSSGAYALVLPTVPVSGTRVMTLDSSGNMGTETSDQVAQAMTSVGANAIATTMTAAGANTIANTITRVTALSGGGVGQTVICNSSGTFTTTSGSSVLITNQSLTVTTSGKPVMLMFQPDGSTTPGYVSPNGYVEIVNNTLGYTVGRAETSGIGAVTSFCVLDCVNNNPAAAYQYTVQAAAAVGTLTVVNMRLVAYEIH